MALRAGDDRRAAFAEVAPYLRGGLICEQLIAHRREYSFDGLGSAWFITEKMSAPGRYPVEVAQVLPARLNDVELDTLYRAGRLANALVGQCDGPFHNEVKLSDDGSSAAIVEPNRRPAGMKIWWLAHWVYGVDFFHAWVDVAFGSRSGLRLAPAARQAATVMLGVAQDRTFAPSDIAPTAVPIDVALAVTAEAHGLEAGELRLMQFSWLSTEPRVLHYVPRDNADFAAMACIVLNSTKTDIREVVGTLQREWAAALFQCTPKTLEAV